LPAPSRFMLIGLTLLASGCASAIRFSADTTVDELGKVVRVTSFASAGNLPDEYLFENYDLVTGGSWVDLIDARAARAAPAPRISELPRNHPLTFNREYTFAREFAPGERIQGDYRRRALVTDRAAVNTISVRTRNLWFVQTYAYEERFEDIVTIDSLKNGVRQIYDWYVSQVALAAAALAEIDQTARDAKALIKARFDAPLETSLEMIERHCLGEMIETDTCLENLLVESEELARQFEFLVSQDALAAELALLFPAPNEVAPAEWRERLEDDVLDRAVERLTLFDETDESRRLEEDVFGVRGFEFLSFRSYPFQLSVRLPGTIVASNADRISSNKLEWRFRANQFVLNDWVLRAHSRVVHGDRIVLGSLGFALILVVGGWLALRGRPRVSLGSPL
jgi:hypothetical protein